MNSIPKIQAGQIINDFQKTGLSDANGVEKLLAPCLLELCENMRKACATIIEEFGEEDLETPEAIQEKADELLRMKVHELERVEILAPALEVWTKWLESIGKAFTNGIPRDASLKTFEPFKPEDFNDKLHEFAARLSAATRNKLGQYLAEQED